MITHQQSRAYFLAAQLITGMGDELFTLSVAILVYAQTKSPLLLSATFAVAYGGATVGYLLVPLLRRFANTRVMIVTDLVSAVSVLLILIAPIGWLWGLQFLLGCLRSVGRPFAYGLIPDLCEDDRALTRLNADFQTVGTISMVCGFVASGLFAATRAITWALAFDALSFLACALLTWRIGPSRASRAPAAPGVGRTFASYGRRLLQITKPLGRDALLAALLVPYSLMFGVNIAFHNQLIALVNQRTSHPLYYVLTELTMALGILLAARWLRRPGALPHGEGAQVRLWLGAAAGMGLTFGLAAWAGTWSGMVGLLFLSAACDGSANIVQMNLLYRRVPQADREQLLSFRFLTRNLGKAVISPLAGLSVQTWGVAGTLAGLGLAIAVMAGAIYVYLSKSLSANPGGMPNPLLADYSD